MASLVTHRSSVFSLRFSEASEDVRENINQDVCMCDTRILNKLYILFQILTAYILYLWCVIECSMLNIRLE